ncbi:SPOR domain-containing protein [Glycocaulis abyssi]|uniref:SPOR domain-containing protein n=1 Tax=Glycocaulis abyssi TaxID=1433403 RepID=A0ABV9N9J1_9PROT
MPSRDRNSTDYDPDAYDTFDARDDGQGRRGPILLLAAAIVLVLFLGVVWSAYNLGVRERNTAPILTADGQPWRTAPEDPGGFETPGQDIEAYALRERGAVETVEIDPAVRPGPEEPVVQPERPALTVETEDADRLALPREEGPREEATAPSEPVAEDTPPEPETRPAEQQHPAEERQPAREEPRPAPPAASASGNFVVQIAAFRTIEEAEEAWIAFVTRFPDLASGRNPSIVEANLGARGIYHRLRIAAFETRDDASRYCQTLSSRGQDCLVAAR